MSFSQGVGYQGLADWPTRLLQLSAACLLLLISACAHHGAVDKPLEHWTPQSDQRMSQQASDERSNDLTVLVAFSGGGTRAAAFAYGVLQELKATPVTTERGSSNLLMETDIISSVSGGSFTAAYYGLYGDRIFIDFEQKFLRKNVEGILLRKMFNPLNWVRLSSGSYGRADMAADYYDEALFDGATFSDMYRPGAPLVVINATDLAWGNRIPFIQTSFDLLCADLDSYPVSRAVAASSAVPVIFSPVTLENFSGTCGYQLPDWITASKADQELTGRKIEAERVTGYLDRNKRPWLHLVDGGISDNLGLRSFYNALDIAGDPASALKGLPLLDTKHILVIAVDAHAKHKSDWMLERYAPSLAEVVGSVSADQIGRYSDDTKELLRSTFNLWINTNSTLEKPITFSFVEASFESLVDEQERDFLNGIGTNFELSDEEVDRLISAGREVLRDSQEYREFLTRSHGL